MSHPKQDSVARRLTAESLSALDRISRAHKARVRYAWTKAARALKADVAAAYTAASGRGQPWDLTALAPHFHALQSRVGVVLRQFHAESSHAMGNAFKDLRKHGELRQCWILSQVTPRDVRPRRGLREASIPSDPGFGPRWSEWVDAYGSALLRNLRLNALNQGTMQDAVEEVDATRANTPAFTIDSALDRLYEWYAADAIAGGMHQPVEDNPGLAEVEVWRTRGDLRVCDDCDANEGLPAEDADGTVPLHPNCNCFYQVVPASFAELLRSGDAGDQDLAAQMDYEGVAPNAMVVRGEGGEVAGKTVVDFEEWAAANGAAVTGGSI